VKSPTLIIAVMLSGAALSALAADPPKDAPKKELTPQQQRMSDCAKQSKGLKAEEHQKFMSDCLKGKKESDAKSDPNERMKSCNEQAGKMKGDERSKFMSECLKSPTKMPVEKTPPVKTPAKEPAKPETPQQRMKDCNSEAGKKKMTSAERKAFMAECLKSEPGGGSKDDRKDDKTKKPPPPPAKTGT
jgi:hypothetical protein